MYNYLDTFRRPYVDTMIGYLDRIQLGYSDLIVFAMENGWSEETIIADIEDMVRRCFHYGSVNVINKVNFSKQSEMEDYIKETSYRIFTYLRIWNNY